MKIFYKNLLTSIITGTLFLLPLTLSAGQAEIQAANELLDVIRFEETMDNAREMSMGMIKQMNPALSKHEAVIREFYNKYMSVETLRQETLAIYAEVFTVTELKDIIAFYNTKAGQKAMEKLPEIMQRTMQTSSARIMQHQNELIEMITQDQAQLDLQSLNS